MINNIINRQQKIYLDDKTTYLQITISSTFGKIVVVCFYYFLKKSDGDMGVRVIFIIPVRVLILQKKADCLWMT